MDALVLHFFAEELRKEAAVPPAAAVPRVTNFIAHHAGNLGNWVRGGAEVAENAIKAAPKETYDVAKMMVTSPRKALREGWAETKKSPILGMGLTGLGVAMGAHEVVKGAPEHRMENAGRLIGGTTTGIMGMTTGFLPGMATGLAGDYAGGLVGRQLDKGIARLRGRPTPAPVPAQTPTQG